MTDFFPDGLHLVGRLGVRAQYTDGQLILTLEPHAQVMRHGVVRASVVAFLIDAVAGVVADNDPEAWALTSDMSVRMRLVPAPTSITATGTIVRAGRRSVTAMAEITGDDGEPVATGAIGFAKLARREGDPPKPQVSADNASRMFGRLGSLSRPLRAEAGIEVLDAAAGVVQLTVTPELRNPAGTLQGALVALLAEAAAEDFVSTRFDVPAVVTDLDIRYLAQARVGPVRTRTRLLGSDAGAPIQVELVDTSVDRVTTLVYARAATVR